MIRKFKHTLSCLALALLLAAALLPARAYAADASLSASASTLRAGNSFELYFDVSGSNILGIEASMSYDSSALSFDGAASAMDGSWSMSQSGGNFTLYNTDESSPINGGTTVIVLYFSVKSDAADGASLSVSISGLASSGAEESSISAGWSNTVAAPLSGNANLDGLWCAQAELGFNGSTEYSITVPYEVSELSLDYSTEHGGAWAEIYGTWLDVGYNTVSVTVYAENGASKTYYIYVTREQDPNYVPSSDAALSSLEVSAGTLSPAFHPDVKEYVVYLPYEIDKLQLSGTARDGKAKSVQQVGSSVLKEGENLLTMQCVAEDDTVMEYTVHAIRMPAFAGELPEIIPPVTETLTPTEPVEPQKPEEEPPVMLELPLMVQLPLLGDVAIYWLAGAALLVLLALVWLTAWAIGRRGGRRKALSQLSPPVSETDDGALPESPAASEAPAAEAAQAAAAEPEAAEEACQTSAEAAEELLPEAPEEPAGENTPEAPVEEAAPAAEDAVPEETPLPGAPSPDDEPFPAEEAFPEGEEPLPDETPLAGETPAEEVPAGEPEADMEKEADDIVNTMSLSDLLEDIRNM